MTAVSADTITAGPSTAVIDGSLDRAMSDMAAAGVALARAAEL